MFELEIGYRETTGRHRAAPETPWWQHPAVGQGRHQPDELCPSEDERRRSEVSQRQRHRL